MKKKLLDIHEWIVRNFGAEEIHFYLGVVLLGIGLWIWNPALSLTVSGSLFVLMSIIWSKK